jgi:hypothetical protein
MSTTSRAKPVAAQKYEAFVDGQVTRAQRRIRLLDVAASGLGLVMATLAYALVMAVLDRWLHLSVTVRQVAFIVYLAAAAAYIAFRVIQPLSRRINPYYAALQVEHVLPGAKNSVINWLDLRDRDLPAAIRGAVTHRAARDLARADLDQAISARRAGWLGGFVAGLFLALLVLFFQGPPQFFSLMGRAFAPFVDSPLATRTRLTIVQPEGGDVTVPVGHGVTFVVEVDGRVPDSHKPDALRFLFHYQPAEPCQERQLEQGDSNRLWTVTLPAYDVHNGFVYKFAGGDAETPEHQVRVRSTPLLTDFQATYHFRPYLNRADATTRDPNLEGLRGTEVTLLAHANRAVQSGRMDVDGDSPIVAERVAGDPRGLRFRLVLDKDGSYRIWFTSTEGERNTEPMPYAIHVLPDRPPVVELTKPGEDVSLPANGVLRLEGSATDDFGVTGLTLRMMVDTLQARPYRKGKSFKLEGGGYPLRIDYKDFVELDKVRLRDGQSLQPGMVIKYWLEATDNCDYPSPNVSKTRQYEVRITEPQDVGNQQQVRQQAGKEQRQHEERQDQQLDREDRARQQQAEKDRHQADRQEQEKNDPQQDKKDQQKGDRQEQGNKDRHGPDQSDARDQDKDRELQEKADRLEQAAGQNDKEQKGDQGDKNAQASGSNAKDKDQTKDNSGEGGRQGKEDPAQKHGDKESRQGQEREQRQSGGQEKAPSGKDQSKQARESKDAAGNQTDQDKQGAGNQSGGQGEKQPNQGQKKGGGEDKQSGQGQEQSGNGSEKQSGSNSAGSKNGKDGSGADSRKQDGGQRDAGTKKSGDEAGQGEHNGDSDRQQNAGAKRKGDGKQSGQRGGETSGNKDAEKAGDEAENKQGSGQRGDAGRDKESPTGQGAQGDKKSGVTRGDKSGNDPKDGRQQSGAAGAKEDAQGDKKSAGDQGQQQGRDPKDSDKQHGGSDPRVGGQEEKKSGASESKDGAQGEKNSRAGQTGDGERKNGEKNPGAGTDKKRSTDQSDKQAGAGKSGDGQKDKEAAAGKESEQTPRPGKDGGSEEKKQGTGQGKADNDKQGDKTSAQSQGQKDGGEKKSGNDDGKGDGAQGAKGQERPGSQEGSTGARPGAEGEKKPGGGQSSEKGQQDGSEVTKQGAGQGKPRTEANGKPPAGSEGQKAPEKIKDEDVDDLIKDLQNGDSEARRDAARKLKDGKDNVSDPRLRQAVEDALKKSGQDRKSGSESSQEAEPKTGGERRGEKAQGEKSGRSDASPSADQKPDGQKQGDGQKAGEPRKADGNQSAGKQPGSEKNDAAGARPGSEKDSERQQGAGRPGKPGEADQKAEGQASERTGQGPPRGRPGDQAVNANVPAPESVAPDPRHQKRAGVLQLEDIKKKVTPDVLKKANMTEDEYRQFLKAYEEMLKRRHADNVGQEKLTDPKSVGGSLSNRASHRVQGDGKSEDIQQGGVALPPPEFREAYNEFTQKRNALERSKEKK